MKKRLKKKIGKKLPLRPGAAPAAAGPCSAAVCPCCGCSTLSESGKYEICSVCGWEDDPAQSADPDLAGGANRFSLNEARAAFSDKKGCGKPDL